MRGSYKVVHRAFQSGDGGRTDLLALIEATFRLPLCVSLRLGNFFPSPHPCP